MTAQPVEQVDPILDHHGPWTEEDYLALPEQDGWRVELIDGSLLVSPVGDGQHQKLGFRLCRELEFLLSEDVEVLHEANVRLAGGRIVVPDVVVTTNLDEPLIYDAADVLLTAEVVSPSGKARDRIIKPGLYAPAGIRWYLLVERDNGLELVLHRLKNGTYVEHSRATEGRRLLLPELDVEIEVDALLRRR
jgi:Uma2 family endonuclease